MSVTNGTDLAAPGDVSAADPRRRPPDGEFREIVESATTTARYVRPTTKNLVNTMLVTGVLRFNDDERRGDDPVAGHPYSSNTFFLDLHHAEVREALKLG